MSEVVQANTKEIGPGGAIRSLSWENLTKDKIATPFPVIYLANTSIQVIGEYDGATVEFQGSNVDAGRTPDPLLNNFDVLFGTNEDPLTFNEASIQKIRNIKESTFWGVPVVKDAGEKTNLTIIIVGRTAA